MTSTETLSPFAGLTSTAYAPEPAARTESVLESPFGSGFAAGFSAAQDGHEAGAGELLDQLADEDFADALEALVDEAAARQLADEGAYTARPSAAEARYALEQWVEPLAAAAERSLDELADRLAPIDPLTVSGAQLTELLDSVAPEQLGVEGFDQFLGGVLRKARALVGGAVNLAKKGIAAVGKILPIGALLGRLKSLVRPLLNRVLKAALNLLPASVRPIARTLAAKLGLGEAAGEDLGSADDPVGRLAEDFDLEVGALLHGEPPTHEDEDESARDGSVGELETARERLAGQLTGLAPNTEPVAELEQFIPAVLAVRPLIKLAVSMIGRDRIVRFLAERIAGLIKGMIGPEAAQTISRPLVDVGLRMLGFEVSAEDGQVLAGEALASTVEGTVLRVLELPAEALADELQLDGAIQQAFAEAAAAAMPDRLLRADLPERETEDEGVWVLMPRSARPAYRYRRYSRVYVVPVTRRLARAVPWSDGGSLESHLLDAGAEQWPVQAEVELFEAVPGTQLGHLAPDASGGAPGEVQALTPEIAGMLLREPGLGRRVPAGAAARFGVRPVPGRRYFRIRPVGQAARRGRRLRRRLVVVFDATSTRPGLCVLLRLTERQAQQLLDQLGNRNLPGALAALGRHYGDALPVAAVARLLRRRGGHAGAADGGAARAGAAADRITAAVTAALSAFLTERSAQLAAAVRDPADGVTISVAFPGVTRSTLDAALPAGQVTVEPGWPRTTGRRRG
jgi:hypothetical protein